LNNPGIHPGGYEKESKKAHPVKTIEKLQTTMRLKAETRLKKEIKKYMITNDEYR
jgi:hypothetical protein